MENQIKNSGEQRGRSSLIEIIPKQNLFKKRKVKVWTSEEDELLLELFQNYPKQWEKIAQKMPGRNQNQCLHRHRRLVAYGGAHQKIWNQSQDEAVLKLVKRHGQNWKVISNSLKSKTGKQIRERYINKLDPRIKKEDWAEEEDVRLIELYLKFGSKWSQISKNMLGRPENRIKNRFYSHIKNHYDFKLKDEIKMEFCSNEQSPNFAQSNTKMTVHQKSQQEDEKQNRIIQNFLESSDFDLMVRREHSKNSITSEKNIKNEDEIKERKDGINEIEENEYLAPSPYQPDEKKNIVDQDVEEMLGNMRSVKRSPFGQYMI